MLKSRASTAQVKMSGVITLISHTPRLILSIFFFVPFLPAAWQHFTAVKGQSFSLSLSFIQFTVSPITSTLKMSLDKLSCAATWLHPLMYCPNFAAFYTFFIQTTVRKILIPPPRPNRPRYCCIRLRLCIWKASSSSTRPEGCRPPGSTSAIQAYWSSPALEVPACTARSLTPTTTRETPSREKGELKARNCR
jgi:hypothetical protein